MKAKDIEAVEFVLLEQLKKHISCEFLDKAMPKITLLGSGGALWIASAGAMFVSKRYRNTACTLGAGLITGSVVCNALLKKLIKRPRPCWIRVPDGMLIEIPRDYSFPSGHTMSSFLAATIIAHANRELVMAAYGVASAIAFSRLYLYVHFPSDIFAGIGFGIGLGKLCCAISDHATEKRTALRRGNRT